MNILVYPGVNDLSEGEDKHLYTRLSTDQKDINKVLLYFGSWSGRSGSFTPTQLLIATWKNYNLDKWDASVCFFTLFMLLNRNLGPYR